MHTSALATAANVRAEMASAAVSQVVLAAHLGTSQQAISRRLSGLVAFDVDELHRIAEFLGVPVSALIHEPQSVAS